MSPELPRTSPALLESLGSKTLEHGLLGSVVRCVDVGRTCITGLRAQRALRKTPKLGLWNKINTAYGKNQDSQYLNLMDASCSSM